MKAQLSKYFVSVYSLFMIAKIQSLSGSISEFIYLKKIAFSLYCTGVKLEQSTFIDFSNMSFHLQLSSLYLASIQTGGEHTFRGLLLKRGKMILRKYKAPNQKSGHVTPINLGLLLHKLFPIYMTNSSRKGF